MHISPSSRFGVYVGLSLPWITVDTWDANLPSTFREKQKWRKWNGGKIKKQAEDSKTSPIQVNKIVIWNNWFQDKYVQQNQHNGQQNISSIIRLNLPSFGLVHLYSVAYHLILLFDNHVNWLVNIECPEQRLSTSNLIFFQVETLKGKTRYIAYNIPCQESRTKTKKTYPNLAFSIKYSPPQTF